MGMTLLGIAVWLSDWVGAIDIFIIAISINLQVTLLVLCDSHSLPHLNYPMK